MSDQESGPTPVICEECGSPPLLAESDHGHSDQLDLVCDCDEVRIHIGTDYDDWPNRWGGSE